MSIASNKRWYTRNHVTKDGPVISGKRRVVVIAEHQLQRPPNNPQAGHNAENFDAVVLGAARERIVEPEVV